MLTGLYQTTHGEPARRLWLPFVLPSFNDLEAARGHVATAPGGRGTWNGYNALKRTWQDAVVLHARRVKAMRGPVVVGLRYVEKSRHRDPDGIHSGASKIILDALGPGRGGKSGWVGAGVLHCDGQHCLCCPPIGLPIEVDPRRPGIEVLLYEGRP